MALEYTNLGESTLDGAITAGATTLDVVSASSFPADGDFWINIEDELIKVGAVSSNTFSSLTRGETGGTAAASHSSGVAVTLVETAQGRDQLRNDLTRMGTYSTMSALTDMSSGDTFHFDGTDTPYSYAVYDGTNWIPYWRGYQCTPFVSGDYAWVNQGTASIDTSGWATVMTVPSANLNQRILKKSAPSTPYVITALVMTNSRGEGDTGPGLVFRQSSDGKLAVVFTRLDIWLVEKWTNATTFSGSYANDIHDQRQSYMWIRIEDDATDRNTSISFDGYNFAEVHTVGRTDHITADEVGFGGYCVDGFDAKFTILSWVES